MKSKTNKRKRAYEIFSASTDCEKNHDPHDLSASVRENGRNGANLIIYIENGSQPINQVFSISRKIMASLRSDDERGSHDSYWLFVILDAALKGFKCCRED